MGGWHGRLETVDQGSDPTADLLIDRPAARRPVVARPLRALAYLVLSLKKGTMTVTKETIIKKIGEDTGWSRTDSKKAMQKLLAIMFKALSNGEDILISGFGKFKVLHKNARLGRNPHTMEEIKLKARKVVSFKASENLRRKTNLSYLGEAPAIVGLDEEEDGYEE
jgi:integration host factor subunit alpha